MYNGNVRHRASISKQNAPCKGFIKDQAPGKLPGFGDGFAFLYRSSVQNVFVKNQLPSKPLAGNNK